MRYKFKITAMSIIYYDKKLKAKAQKLRREQTPQERKLWYEFLRRYPVQFRRQKQFDCYIVDFYCAKAKLVVEIDGSQHYTEEGIAHDENRTEVLKKYQLKVIRFSNHDVNTNFDGVCAVIDKEVKSRLE